MKRLRILFLGLLAASGLACAADDAPNDLPNAAGPALFIAGDSEGFITKRVSAEYLRELSAAGPGVGVRYRAHDFTQGGWSRMARQFAIAGKSRPAPQGQEWQGEAGVISQGGRQLFSFDGTYGTSLAKSTRLEVFANRDYVETAAALDRGIAATFAGASVEQALDPHWTAVGLLGRQQFTDGNHRNHARLRLIWQPDLDSGLTLQFRQRFYRSGTSDTPGAYFNPERYRESMFMLGYRKHGKNWRGSVLAGLGRQHVGSDAGTPTGMLEASFEKRLKRDQTVSLRAGLNRSASFGGPDYRYRYLQATWSVRF